jgi:hypothetical protein
MDSHVTSITAATGRAESGRGSPHLSPSMSSASGRSVVTRADEGVAPVSRGATQPATQGSTGVADITHDLVRGQLSEYLDDSLGEAVRHRIDRHIASCAPCAAHLETLRTTVQALGQMPAPRAPKSARARILEAARSEQAQREQA